MIEKDRNRVYSSAVERLTADQQVPGSNPGVPFFFHNYLSLKSVGLLERVTRQGD